MTPILIVLSFIQLIVALIGSAKAIETVGLHQQTPVQYGSQIAPVLYGALGEGGLLSESRTLPDEAGPKMSALPTSGLATVPKSLKHTQPLVYRPNPYVYIPAIGQVAKPEETVATNPFVYTSYKPKLVAQVLAPGYIPTIVAPARAPGPGGYIPEEGEENEKVERNSMTDALSTISEETDPKLVAQALAPGYIPTLVLAPGYYQVICRQVKPVVPHGFAYSFTEGICELKWVLRGHFLGIKTPQ